MILKKEEAVGIIKEFRDFAVKGNVADMAVGIIIGAGFGKIVSSLVQDIINPPLGLLVGGVDFKGLEIVIKEAIGSAPSVTIKIGAFIQNCFDFTIQAFAIFMVIKVLNRLRRGQEEKKSAPPAQEVLLTEIRDILKERRG